MVVAQQVLILLIFIAIGYALRKTNFIPSEAAGILSKILIYVFCPALTLNTFINQFKISNLSQNYKIILISAVIVILLMLSGKLISRLFTKDSYVRNVYAYSFTTANFGYIGYALVQAVYGEEALLTMMVFSIPLTIYTYTEGYRGLVNSKKVSLANLLNPGIIAIIIGAIIGLSGINFPAFLTDIFAKAGNCMSPVSMIMTGIVIADYNLKEILFEKKAYIVSLIRLIGIPAVVCGVLYLLNAPEEIILISLMTYAMPCGLNTVVFPKLVNKDCKLGASFAVVSAVLSLATIPFMEYIFNIVIK